MEKYLSTHYIYWQAGINSLTKVNKKLSVKSVDRHK